MATGHAGAAAAAEDAERQAALLRLHGEMQRCLTTEDYAGATPANNRIISMMKGEAVPRHGPPQATHAVPAAATHAVPACVAGEWVPKGGAGSSGPAARSSAAARGCAAAGEEGRLLLVEKTCC